MMKKPQMMFVALVAFFVMGLGAAEARHCPADGPVYISGYDSCGVPVYHQRVFAGYDRCGYPRFVVQRVYRPDCRPVHSHWERRGHARRAKWRHARREGRRQARRQRDRGWVCGVR